MGGEDVEIRTEAEAGGGGGGGGIAAEGGRLGSGTNVAAGPVVLVAVSLSIDGLTASAFHGHLISPGNGTFFLC